jgi:hypothetical protein
MLLLLALAAQAQTAPPAPESAGPGAAQNASTIPAPVRDIVQQRLPDGRVIFTDRPVSDARTLRTWQYQPEDPQLAASRRAAAERESTAVSERIARQLEQQREIDREIEMARLEAAADAARDAARERNEAEPPQVIVWPRRALRPHPSLRPHPPGARPPPHRPGPKLAPRPGATRPPGPNQPPEWPY